LLRRPPPPTLFPYTTLFRSRLPDNPRVVQPLEETGQFGGVWHRAFLGLTDYLSIGKLMEARLIKWDAPDPTSLRVVPNVVEKWEDRKSTRLNSSHVAISYAV